VIGIDSAMVRAQVTRFGLQEVAYVESGGSEKKVPRQHVTLPWRELLDQALDDHGDDALRVKAASLWMWRSPDARAAIAKLGDQPLGKALRAVDASLNGGLELAGSTSRVGDILTVSYEFVRKDPAMLLDWSGDGFAYAEHGLTWTTKKNVEKGNRSESQLPRAAARVALSPPFCARAKLWLRPSKLALIGVEAGGQCVRLGFATDQPLHRLGAVCTGPNGNFTYTEAGEGMHFPSTEPVDVMIRVAEDGKVEASIDQIAPALPPFPTLPRGAPVTLVMQAYQYGNATTTLELESVELSGKPAAKN
jgi:hypothetical protein